MLKFRTAYIFIASLFFFLLATQGTFFPDDYYIADEATSSEANLFFLIFWPVAFTILALVTWARRPARSKLPISLWIMLGAVALSILFSELPAVSARRGLALFLSVGCAVFLVKAAKDPEEIISGLYWGLSPLVVLSVGGALLFPSHAVHYASPDLIGDWKGVFSHKNFTAYAACITLLISFHRLRTGGLKLSTLSIFLLSALLMAKANSLFMFLMAPICYLAAAAMAAKSRASKIYVKMIGIGALLIMVPIAILTMYFPRWPELLGTTLNNRTEIWSTLLSAQSGREILGHGFGAVHNVGENSVFWKYGEWRIQTLGHGHSGQLDVYAATGIIGWAATNLFLFSRMTRLNISAKGPSRHQGLVCAFLAWIVITRSFVESNLLSTGRLDWFLCCLSILALFRWYNPRDTSDQPG